MAVMEIENWPVDKLVYYANNPRKNDNVVDDMAAFIQEYGFRVPVIARPDGTVIDGHLRLKAAKKLKFDSVPVHVANDMTDAQVKAFRLAINKSAELADWDMELVSAELEDLVEQSFDIDLTGFSFDDIIEQETPGLTDEDEVPETPEEPVVKLGDLWLLGDHRLLCGDSTDKAQVERLMDGEMADMVFTDPPYGVDYHSQNKTMYYGNNKKGKEREKIKGDNNTKIYNIVFEILKNNCNGVMYVFCGAGYETDVLLEIRKSNIKIINTLIWNKDRFGGQALGANYKPCFELFYYLQSKHVKNRKWAGSNNQQTLWTLKRDCKNNFHPTQKPVELVEKAIMNHSVGIILDLFLGSGSTLIACEKTNRKCFGMEIDPHYTQVILQRWSDYTGKDPVREDGIKFSELICH